MILTTLLTTIRRRLRQRLCHHECCIDDITRNSDGDVECPCRRCRKILSAPCGLALPAELTWRGRI